jgi:hypothetical protein
MPNQRFMEHSPGEPRASSARRLARLKIATMAFFSSLIAVLTSASTAQRRVRSGAVHETHLEARLRFPARQDNYRIVPRTRTRRTGVSSPESPAAFAGEASQARDLRSRNRIMLGSMPKSATSAPLRIGMAFAGRVTLISAEPYERRTAGRKTVILIRKTKYSGIVLKIRCLKGVAVFSLPDLSRPDASSH